MKKGGTVDNKPETYVECGVFEDDDMILESGDQEADVGGIGGFFSTITGAVVGGGAVAWELQQRL